MIDKIRLFSIKNKANTSSVIMLYRKARKIPLQSSYYVTTVKYCKLTEIRNFHASKKLMKKIR